MTSPATTDPAIDVISFGESLVDFLPDRRGVSLRDVESFRKTVGGAPTNLAVGLARLGCRPGLIGKVAEDEFGEFILDTLESEGVETRGIRRTDRAQTGLTFVTLEADGERSFQFYRDETADVLLREEEVDEELIDESALFQIGSNVMTEPGIREAALRAIRRADASGSLVSFDPNIRVHVWEHPDEARRRIEDVLDCTDILKLNEEELAFLLPETSPREAWHEAFAPRGVEAFAFTEGSDGARLWTREGDCAADALDVDVVDTTGAGDGFLSGFLAELVHHLRDDASLETPERAFDWPIERWQSILELGCRVGSVVCTELGATPGLPERSDLEDDV
jgi:fructokinase